MDAQEVIRCLNASEERMDSDGTLIAEAQTYLRLFPAVICQYASRNCNNVAHCQAKRAFLFKVLADYIKEKSKETTSNSSKLQSDHTKQQESRR
ncbi:unnamed protein product [Prunus armeniaca]|uniref:RNase H type-1 domain-containing protein n=1 Tax=Prunus armeniaca TaxID=36596 RepID=A0A6J5TU86_PRUAR|nr:unnamed protein product [Prunus armeniaca]